MKEIISLKLFLENYEAVKFDICNIKTINIIGIKKSIYFNHGRSQESMFADEIIIRISKKGNKHSAYADDCYPNENQKRILPFDRLQKYNDITSLEIKYSNHTTECINANFEEDSSENNLYQTSKFHDFNGELIIVISPKLTVEKFIHQYKLF